MPTATLCRGLNPELITTMNLTYDIARSHFLDWVKTESLRKHGFAVEKTMRAAAHRHAGGDVDEEKFAITGLLHDGDYERWPTGAPRGTSVCNRRSMLCLATKAML